MVVEAVVRPDAVFACRLRSTSWCEGARYRFAVRVSAPSLVATRRALYVRHGA